MKILRNDLVSLCLVLIRIADVAAYLLPPTNVTLLCHNLTNILQWKYDKAAADLKFRVDISSISSPPEHPRFANSSTLQIDLSSISDPFGEYVVTVTAVKGQNESETSPPDGLQFSYLKDSQAEQKCFVDFPSVNVTAIPDDNVEFSFHHPWLLYHKSSTKNGKKKKNNALIRDLPVFSYNVVVINQMERHHSFRCKQSMCKHTVPVDGSQKNHCLKVSGELENIDVRATQVYCSLPHQETDFTPLYVVLGLLILAVFALVLFMVYRKMTRTHTPLPSSMSISNGKVKKPIMKEPRDDDEMMIVPEVTPTSPTQLLLDTDVSEPTLEGTQPDFRAPIGVGIHQGNEPPDKEVRRAGDAEYMPGGRLDEDDVGQEVSPYESRPVLVEMAPEDLAQGYRD